MDKMAIWSRFTQSGKVEDYLMYKSLQNKKPQYDEDLYDEDEYGRSDTQGTEYR